MSTLKSALNMTGKRCFMASTDLTDAYYSVSIDKIKLVYGSVTTDLFASRINARVGRFYSYTPDPEACGHDVFSFSWQQEHFNVFPPFSCIPKVINKMNKNLQ